MGNDLDFSDEDPGESRIERTEAIQVERVRRKTGQAEGVPKRRLGSDAAGPPGTAIASHGDEALERVGRRHRIRPELAALIVGAAFIVAALVKPWGAVVPVPSPSTSAPVNEEPFVIGQGSHGPPLPPYLDDLSRGWAAVDWSFLRATDIHLGWGISTASMAEFTTSTPRPTLQGPAIAWTPVPIAAPTTVLDVDPGKSVFAIAITWPEDVRVTSVSVEYLGSGYDPPYVTSGGMQPYTQLTPLPAEAVVSPVEEPTSGFPRSGQFWVPPAITSPVTADRSAASAWHLLPWPWPLGGYTITVTSQHRPTTLSLFLRETPEPPIEPGSTAAPQRSLAS